MNHLKTHGLLGCTLYFILALFSTAVLAQQDVIEINQQSVLDGGISMGDAPGFPIVLDTPGHYRLTSDLVWQGAENQRSATAIEVWSVEAVMIDLNGFQIVHSSLCNDPDLSCVSALETSAYDYALSNTVGISAMGTAPDIRLSNGYLIGFDQALSCDTGQCILQDLKMSGCEQAAFKQAVAQAW